MTRFIHWNLPRVPARWQAAFQDYQRRLARQYTLVAAWVALVMVPVFQISDWWIDTSIRGLWWHHLAIRLPPLCLALATLWLYYHRPHGYWPRLMAVALGLSIMLMMAGLFIIHHVAETEAVDLMVRGLIMTTAAVTIVATAGIRDLALLYGVPFSVVVMVVLSRGTGFITAMEQLIHPLMMAFIGCVIAEVLFRSRIVAFNDRQRLHYNASTDPLTALLNRRAMESQLQIEHARCSRHDDCYALVMADLDRFKAVNDTYGHDVGDEILTELAERMRQCVRLEDAIARWGGEEFLILLRATGPEEAAVVAEKIRATVSSQRFSTGIGTLSVTISMGIGVFRGDDEPAGVIKRADQALYQAKQNGRNRIEMID